MHLRYRLQFSIHCVPQGSVQAHVERPVSCSFVLQCGASASECRVDLCSTRVELGGAVTVTAPAAAAAQFSSADFHFLDGALLL